tara:strand:+ start:73 stop:558 length:486 start_codon:yes stop_codon:yes gene_type:complete
MRLSIIVAMDRNQLIGADGALPWRIPDDLKNFKKITMGRPILMGRKTHESIGRVLPGRENIVLTSNKDYIAEGCTIKNTLDQVYSYCDKEEELFVMGGANLYSQTLIKAERLFITEINADLNGDTFFPKYNRNQWEEVKRKNFNADEENEFDYSFTILERR